MARDESHREDLLREATALVERIELSPRTSPLPVPVRDRERENATGATDSTAENIVIGFRACGAMSIFFGADPVYQFNAAGELRRAYCDGLLFKATHRRFVYLQRVREQNEVQLLRRDLTNAEQDAFIARMQSQLRGLADELAQDGHRVVGQVPADASILERVRAWFATHNAPSIASAPRV